MTDAAVATPQKRKPGRKSNAEREAMAAAMAVAAQGGGDQDAEKALGGWGGSRSGSGRKNAAVEAATADAHIIYQKAKAQKEAYQAKLAELDYQVRSGQYVPRADVQQAAATAFATIAQSLRSIPDNLERRLGVSPEIAEEVGIQIDEAMNNLADELEKMAGAAI